MAQTPTFRTTKVIDEEPASDRRDGKRLFRVDPSGALRDQLSFFDHPRRILPITIQGRAGSGKSLFTCLLASLVSGHSGCFESSDSTLSYTQGTDVTLHHACDLPEEPVVWVGDAEGSGFDPAHEAKLYALNISISKIVVFNFNIGRIMPDSIFLELKAVINACKTINTNVADDVHLVLRFCDKSPDKASEIYDIIFGDTAVPPLTPDQIEDRQLLLDTFTSIQVMALPFPFVDPDKATDVDSLNHPNLRPAFVDAFRTQFASKIQPLLLSPLTFTSDTDGSTTTLTTHNVLPFLHENKHRINAHDDDTMPVVFPSIHAVERQREMDDAVAADTASIVAHGASIDSGAQPIPDAFSMSEVTRLQRVLSADETSPLSPVRVDEKADALMDMVTDEGEVARLVGEHPERYARKTLSRRAEDAGKTMAEVAEAAVVTQIEMVRTAAHNRTITEFRPAIQRHLDAVTAHVTARIPTAAEYHSAFDQAAYDAAVVEGREAWEVLKECFPSVVTSDSPPSWDATLRSVEKDVAALRMDTLRSAAEALTVGGPATAAKTRAEVGAELDALIATARGGGLDVSLFAREDGTDMLMVEREKAVSRWEAAVKVEADLKAAAARAAAARAEAERERKAKADERKAKLEAEAQAAAAQKAAAAARAAQARAEEEARRAQETFFSFTKGWKIRGTRIW